MTFKTVEADVRTILKDDMIARCDDMALYGSYAYRKVSDLGYGEGWLVKVFSDRRFRIIHGIAPYGTVSRVRRRLQRKDATLKAPPEIVAERKKAEQEYKKYARAKR